MTEYAGVESDSSNSNTLGNDNRTVVSPVGDKELCSDCYSLGTRTTIESGRER